MRKLVFSVALAALLFVGVGLTSGGGVAFAHSDSNPAFGDNVGDAPSPGPAGSHIIPDTAPGHPGAVNGFNFGVDAPGPDFDNPAVIGITHNPNCPLHPHYPQS